MTAFPLILLLLSLFLQNHSLSTAANIHKKGHFRPNPLLWRPITGIGSFDLPSYDIEVTPFLGTILDGKTHEFAFSVTNALNVWYIDANLHVWLDRKRVKTKGHLLKHYVSPAVVTLASNLTGINGNILTTVNKSVSSVGWVKSSHGNITTNSTQRFDFSNFMVLGEDGNLQIVNQTISFNDSVHAKLLLHTCGIKTV